MIPILRIVLGWLCFGVACIALWQDLSRWVGITAVVSMVLLHGGFARLKPVVRKTDGDQAGMVVVAAFAIFPFLIGAFTGQRWLCWFVLATVCALGIGRDAWLLIHQKGTDNGL